MEFRSGTFATKFIVLQIALYDFARVSWSKYDQTEKSWGAKLISLRWILALALVFLLLSPSSRINLSQRSEPTRYLDYHFCNTSCISGYCRSLKMGNYSIEPNCLLSKEQCKIQDFFFVHLQYSSKGTIYKIDSSAMRKVNHQFHLIITSLLCSDFESFFI